MGQINRLASVKLRFSIFKLCTKKCLSAPNCSVTACFLVNLTIVSVMLVAVILKNYMYVPYLTTVGLMNLQM